jgi:predicted transcriptional regulator
LEDTRKSWIPVMKVYLALHCVNQPCTLATLEYVTGLTKYKVRDCLKLLEKSNVIKRELKYLCSDIEDDFICLGSEIDINAFGIPPAEM